MLDCANEKDASQIHLRRRVELFLLKRISQRGFCESTYCGSHGIGWRCSV